HKGRVSVTSARHGDQLELRVRHRRWFWGSLHSDDVTAHFEVPRGVELVVEMGVGDLTASDLSAPARLTLGVGDMEVTYDPATAGEVTGHVWVGEADLDAGRDTRETSGIAPSPFHWRGASGGKALDFRVGVGDLNVEARRVGRLYSTLPK